MKTSNRGSPSDRLPITRDLTLAYVFSLVVALIMTTASTIGIIYRSVIYPTEEMSMVFVSNDMLNLVLGLPILLGSMWLARRGNLIGLLCWPGALFFVLYIYTAYLLGIPLNALFLLYLILVTLSVYTIIGIVTSIDGDAVYQRLTGVVPVRTAGGILAGIAILFAVYQIVNIITALINQRPVDSIELAQWIDDLAVGSPALLVGGFLMLRRKTLGYVAGMGLLLLCSILFLGVIPYMVVQPLLSDSPIDVIGILIVLVIGSVSFIPFALFVRGALSDRSSPSA